MQKPDDKDNSMRQKKSLAVKICHGKINRTQQAIHEVQ